MELGLNTSLKQEQTLSPQMLQSLALLHMPVMELRSYIQEEIESNPALEIPDHEFGEIEGKEADSTLPDDRLDDADASLYETLSLGQSASSDEVNNALENTSSLGESLSEHLEKQLLESDVPETVEEIAMMLISNLDSNGFFVMSLESLFENRPYSADQISQAVNLVQGFDPYGICVEDFRHSLVLQAKHMGMAQSDIRIFSELVFTQLEKMKDGKTKEVAAALHIESEDLEVFWNILKSLTPFPGRSFSSEADSYVVPEFSIHRRNGSLVLEMNRESLPGLEISQDFEALASDSQAASYVRDSVRKAKDLIKQVDLRYKTIYKTALVIMEKQKNFFFEGPKALKPMTLKDVAEEVGVHEATMSRLAQAKYVDTDYGTVPIKQFFTQGVSSDEGALSRNAVKEHIKEILSENPKFSDQKVSDALAQKGIKCARRTVNKYRTELGL